MACCAVDDYINGVIKKHENTREDKEQDRIRHVDATNAHTGPIFLAYRRQEELKRLVEQAKKEKALYDFVSEDGIRHRVWKIGDPGMVKAVEEALKYIKENSKIKTLTITSDNESPVIEYSDLILNLNFGIEKVGFVTKGFSATILNIFLLGIFLGESRTSFSKEKFESYLKELEKIINYIPKVIEISENYFEENKETLKATDRFIAIGYGGALGIAKEFETKFTETVSHVHQFIITCIICGSRTLFIW